MSRYIEWRGEPDPFVDDDTMLTATRLAQVFEDRPHTKTDELMSHALWCWEPCPARAELPN